MEYDVFIQLTSNILDISCIVDRHDYNVINESIT